MLLNSTEETTCAPGNTFRIPSRALNSEVDAFKPPTSRESKKYAKWKCSSTGQQPIELPRDEISFHSDIIPII